MTSSCSVNCGVTGHSFSHAQKIWIIEMVKNVLISLHLSIRDLRLCAFSIIILKSSKNVFRSKFLISLHTIRIFSKVCPVFTCWSLFTFFNSQCEREEFETDYKQKSERERVLLTEENKKLSSELDQVRSISEMQQIGGGALFNNNNKLKSILRFSHFLSLSGTNKLVPNLR